MKKETLQLTPQKRRFIRNYSEQLYTKKFIKPRRNRQISEHIQLPKLNQEETKNLDK
jgi:hypothetical protein